MWMHSINKYAYIASVERNVVIVVYYLLIIFLELLCTLRDVIPLSVDTTAHSSV